MHTSHHRMMHRMWKVNHRGDAYNVEGRSKQQLLCSEGQCWTPGTNEAHRTVLIGCFTLLLWVGHQALSSSVILHEPWTRQRSSSVAKALASSAHHPDSQSSNLRKDIGGCCVPSGLRFFLKVWNVSSLRLVCVSFSSFPLVLPSYGDFRATSRLERNNFL